jgi:hypothetical protein
MSHHPVIEPGEQLADRAVQILDVIKSMMSQDR